MRRLGFVTVRWATCLAALVTTAVPAAAAPAVFWVSEPVGPGEVVLLSGGDLGGVREVLVWRLSDDDPGGPPPGFVGLGPTAVRVNTLQPSEGSLKFVLPARMSAGVFAMQLGGRPRLINVPRVDWSQPTRLLPGLNANEAAPGGTVQIIGRNFLLDDSKKARVKAALRAPDARLVWMKVVQARKYSILAVLPPDVPLGVYELWVHNGSGGSYGWGSGESLRIRQPEQWPAKVFDLKEFGAHGDNVTDDSNAFRHALDAAEENGGGVVYFPAGTYRLSGWFPLPRRVVVRGEGKEVTWLKWPQTAPRSVADFIPAVLYGSGEYSLEHLSLMVRNAKTVLQDLSFDSLLRVMYSARAPIREMEPLMRPVGETRDIFLRDLRIHYFPYAGRPSADPTRDPQWEFGKWGITNAANQDLTFAVAGARNVEVSDCEFVGTQRFLDLENARIVGSDFSDQMGVSWTDLGGQHVVFEGNRIVGASSWRSGMLPIRHLYIAHNVSRNIERGEREALTFDVNALLGRREGSNRVDPWQGKVASASGRMVRLQGAAFQPDSYQGFDVLIVSGKGAGQYRVILGNTSDTLTVGQGWDVPADETSVVLVYRLSGHVIFYGNVAEDTSVLGQIWGHLYDALFDSNEAKRNQGMWGLAGWFVQWLNNRLEVAVTYHSRVGPAGRTPEGGAEYGYVGFTVQGRITGLPIPFEYVRGAVVRGNRLSYGHRVLVMWGYGGERKKMNFVAARDIVIDHNQIDHTPIGVEVDANVEGAVIAGNTFKDVQEPVRLHAPERVLVLAAP